MGDGLWSVVSQVVVSQVGSQEVIEEEDAPMCIRYDGWTFTQEGQL